MELFCELRWVIFRLQAALRPANAGGLSLGRDVWDQQLDRLCLARARILLRQLLRGTPNWSAGHLRLGFVEFALSRLGGRDPRSVIAARLSAEATLSLLALGGRSERGERLRARAQALLGRIQMSEGDQQAAIAFFESVLRARELFRADVRFLYEILEDLGGSLMSIGQYEESKQAFRSIPEQFRSPQTAAALDFLAARS